MNMMRRSLALVTFAVAMTAVGGPAIRLGTAPSVSGDGSRFAFAWSDRIWLAATTGGVARCVTPGASRSAAPVLSPDGRRLAFTSGCDGCANHVFELDLATGLQRKVSHHTERTLPVAWIDGGSNLLVIAQRDHAGLHADRIAVLPVAERGNIRALFDMEGTDPALSPDGTRLVFRRYGDRIYRKRPLSVTSTSAGEIWSYCLADGVFTPLVKGREDARNPQWAAGGKGFFYLRSVRGIRNVFFHDVSGADTALTDFQDDHVRSLSVSADGTVAVFSQGFNFWRLDLTRPGAKPERIDLSAESESMLPPATRRRSFTSAWNDDSDGCVAFTGDGMQVAFTAGGALYVMDTVLREPRLVMDAPPAYARDCAFSPDDGTLYVVLDRGDGSDIWRAERAEPDKAWWENMRFRTARIVTDDERRRDFSLSPDGASFAWTSGSGRLAFADTNGIVRARGPNALARHCNYSWSPDGRYVAAQTRADDLQYDIFVISTTEEGRCWPLTRNFLYDGCPNWSRDGQIIAWQSERPDVAPGMLLSYVYLDAATEARETHGGKIAEARLKTGGKKPKQKGKFRIAPEMFEGLADRVRVTKVRGEMPFFADDSRTLAFADGKVTKSIRLPDNLAPKVRFQKTGSFCRWLMPKKGGTEPGTMLWEVGGKPAHGDTAFGFTVYQTTNLADYRELAFRTAWGRLRDEYYDASMRGLDWTAIRAKYLPYARAAYTCSSFDRIMQMMLGELDSSHLSFDSSRAACKGWEGVVEPSGPRETTRHLGLRFDADHRGAGWKVRDVIEGSPVERSGEGIRPGDVVSAVNGVPVTPATDPAAVLNGPAGMKVVLTVGQREIRVETISYEAARQLLVKAEDKARRAFVHAQSKGRFGYLVIAAMDGTSLDRFRQEVYAEGIGREGIVIDVRTNHGGNTGELMLMTLFGAVENQRQARGIGYERSIGRWGGPYWLKPIVVLCSGETASNAEIFSHAIQDRGRGKLVGCETGGRVISTSKYELLGFGRLSSPHIGIFLPDGRDMEFHGARPDVEVENAPGEIVKGIDRQLETAIGVLDGEVRDWKARQPPPRLTVAH